MLTPLVFEAIWSSINPNCGPVLGLTNAKDVDTIKRREKRMARITMQPEPTGTVPCLRCRTDTGPCVSLMKSSLVFLVK